MSEEAKIPFTCRLKPKSLGRLRKIEEQTKLTPSTQIDLAVEEYLARLDGNTANPELVISSKELTRAAEVVGAMGSSIPLHLLLEIFKHQNKE